MLRSYLWLMLLNVYAKSNIFAFAYLATIFRFWFFTPNFTFVKDINKAAILILCLQYLTLLFDINSTTSPLPLPNNSTSLSLLDLLIADPKWVQFIAANSQYTDNRSFLLSFLTNSIIVFLTEAYFTVFTLTAAHFLTLILRIYNRYNFILHKLLTLPKHSHIYLNYSNYKHLTYRITHFLY